MRNVRSLKSGLEYSFVLAQNRVVAAVWSECTLVLLDLVFCRMTCCSHWHVAHQKEAAYSAFIAANDVEWIGTRP